MICCVFYGLESADDFCIKVICDEYEKIILVLLSVNLLFSCILGIAVYRICYVQPEGTKTQYVMYVGTNDKDTHEQSIVCFFYDVSEEDVYAIADEIIKKLNQDTVLIEKRQTETEFYGGK